MENNVSVFFPLQKKKAETLSFWINKTLIINEMKRLRFDKKTKARVMSACFPCGSSYSQFIWKQN
jgi:hypothetical protein